MSIRAQFLAAFATAFFSILAYQGCSAWLASGEKSAAPVAVTSAQTPQHFSALMTN